MISPSKLFSVVFVTVLLGTASAALGAPSTLSLCNRNPDRAIFAAVLRQVGGGAGWQAVGWYRADANKCFDVGLGEYSGKAYVYAEDEKGETNWGEGNVTFCVDKTNAFTIANADTTPCKAANLKTVHSDEVAIQPGANTWTASPNIATVNFCNKSSAFSIFASLATRDGETWQSRGWWEVKANDCRLVTLGKYAGTFYYHGEYNGGTLEWGSGPFTFCVNKKDAFTLSAAEQAARCSGANLQMVKASEAQAVSGTTTVTFDAVDLKTVLKVCNDTTFPLTAAHAIASSAPGQWRSRGWLALGAKECRELDFGTYAGKAYFYAERNGGDIYWGSGPVEFCVNKTQPFDLDDATNKTKCSGNIAQKMVPAYELTLTPGVPLQFTLSP